MQYYIPEYFILSISYSQGGLGGAKAFANSETLINLLKKQAGSNKLYGAICASPAIALEPHGLLKVTASSMSRGNPGYL